FYVPPGGGNSFVSTVFFGTRSSGDNETGEAQLWSWKKAAVGWVPIHLGTVTITLGAKTGTASCDVLATEYFADTLVIATGSAASSQAISLAADTVASVRFDTEGGFYGRWLLKIGTA